MSSHSFQKPLIPNLMGSFITWPVQLLVLKEPKYAVARPEAEQQHGKEL
jgi:hypothetical protein